MELTHLKLSKTEKGFTGPNNIELYVPLDPKYLYSTKYGVNG
jgi:hypothetical protein